MVWILQRCSHAIAKAVDVGTTLELGMTSVENGRALIPRGTRSRQQKHKHDFISTLIRAGPNLVTCLHHRVWCSIWSY